MTSWYSSTGRGHSSLEMSCINKSLAEPFLYFWASGKGVLWYYSIMPCPSARTKYFLSWTKLKLSKTKILSKVKKSIFCFQKSFKWNFLFGRALKTCFELEIFNLNDFWKQKTDFWTMNKIFVQDNFNIVLDKKYFVWADGGGKSQKTIWCIFIPQLLHLQVIWCNRIFLQNQQIVITCHGSWRQPWGQQFYHFCMTGIQSNLWSEYSECHGKEN